MVLEECGGVEKEVLIHLSSIKETNLSDLSNSIGRSLSNTYKVVEKLVDEDIISDDYKRDKNGINLKERIIRVNRDRVKIKTTYRSFIRQQVYMLVCLAAILTISIIADIFLVFAGSTILALLLFLKNAWDFKKDPDYRQVLKEVIKKSEVRPIETPVI
jgi:hypothetical protein